MPCTHEQEKCARDRRTADTLGDIAAEILAARDLVWAGWLASQQVDGEAGTAIGELLDTVAHRLAAVAEKTERAGGRRAIPMRPDAPKKTVSRLDVDCAILDATDDARVLDIVLTEAGESERQDGIDGACNMLLLPEDVFLALRRTCNHMVDSMREVERLFYEAEL